MYFPLYLFNYGRLLVAYKSFFLLYRLRPIKNLELRTFEGCLAINGWGVQKKVFKYFVLSSDMILV